MVLIELLNIKKTKKMGTTSTVRFYSEFSNKPIVNIYQQFDGYIFGVGYELANLLKDKKVINGYNIETMANGCANGMGCLAAQYIAHIKQNIGGVYIEDLDDEEEYNYHVKFIKNQLIIEVGNFHGTPKELLEYKD